MGIETLERDDLSIYVIAGVPRSFKAKLQQFVREESKKDGDVVLVDSELTEWLVARLLDAKRPRRDRTPASRALWRAFSALSAARYHLQNQATEERVRDLRMKVEELWREISPMFPDEGDAAEGLETGLIGDNGAPVELPAKDGAPVERAAKDGARVELVAKDGD